MNNRSDQFQEWELEKIFDGHPLKALLVETTRDNAFYCFLDHIEKESVECHLYNDYYSLSNLPDIRLEVALNLTTGSLTGAAGYYRVGSHELIAAYPSAQIQQHSDLASLLNDLHHELKNHPAFERMTSHLSRLGNAVSALHSSRSATNEPLKTM
jgi:hypothetical protein